MNIYDISTKAGVSIATVSRVINGNSYVSDKTRSKVLEVIKECGYTPNAFARGLGLNTMHTIGLLCADASDPYIASAVHYVEQELRKNNYDSLLCCTGYDITEKQKYMDLLLSKRIDAVILIGSNFVESDDEDNQYIRDASKQVPIMIINGAISHENIFSALCDDFQTVYDTTRTLQQFGCNGILYLYNSKSYSSNKKLSGYLTAMENSIDWSEKKDKYVHYVTGGVHEIKQYLNTLYRNGLPIDAIVTSEDLLAISALKFAKENHIPVPEKLQIVGYNNSAMAQFTDPEISSIDNKLEAVCCNCVTTLMGVFRGQAVPFKTVFSGELKKRGSTRF